MLAGAITCFAGYRLFRFVLAIWGFILGAGIGSSMMGGDSAIAMIGAGLAGGLLGALALVFAYFVGVALVGAGLGALVTSPDVEPDRRGRSSRRRSSSAPPSPARSARCCFSGMSSS